MIDRNRPLGEQLEEAWGVLQMAHLCLPTKLYSTRVPYDAEKIGEAEVAAERYLELLQEIQRRRRAFRDI